MYDIPPRDIQVADLAFFEPVRTNMRHIRGELQLQEFSLNKAVIELLDSGINFVGAPMDTQAKGEEVSGKATFFRVTTSDTLDATFALVIWNNYIPEIRIHTFDNGLQKHERLKSAGRMSIMTAKDGNWLVELTALKYSPDGGRPTLKVPTIGELNELVSQDFNELMLTLGALKVGTRGEIDDETSKRRNYLAMTVKPNDIDPILAAYTATRVLALVKDFGL
jgi:hypothetical protein